MLFRSVPTANGYPRSIAPGPDGALWFTERDPAGNKVGRITTTGLIAEFAIPSDRSGAHSITNGPDGALWFTEYYGSRIGRLALP